MFSVQTRTEVLCLVLTGSTFIQIIMIIPCEIDTSATTNRCGLCLEGNSSALLTALTACVSNLWKMCLFQIVKNEMLKITAGSFITLEMEDQFFIHCSVYTVLNMSRLYFTPKSKERNSKCIIS